MYNRAMHIPVPPVQSATWLYRRYAIWEMAGAYEGLWTAYDICGREYRLMENALLTEIRKKPIWSKEFDTLDVYGKDRVCTGTRAHDGTIVVDRAFPRRARRTVEYAGAERSVQNLEISTDGNVIYVFPMEPQYDNHILRRSQGLLTLN
jgi:hypothetical protein